MGEGTGATPKPREFTEEGRIVETCIRVAKQRRRMEPCAVARKVKGWTCGQWDDAHLRYLGAQMKRCHAGDGGEEIY